MKQKNSVTFIDGMRDSIPIAIVYFVVSFTLGVTIAKYAFPAWYAALFSAINFTSVGQATGIKMIAETATLLEIGIAVFIVNLRYILTGLSISQKLDTKSKWKRALIGLFITDEMYAIVAEKKKITFAYYIGASPLPYACWVLGTAVGAVADAYLPPRLQAAMGIALFCMFIGLIIPPATRDKRLFFTIVVSIGFSCLFYFTPYLNRVSFGIRIVLSAVVSALLSALIFPISNLDDDSEYKHGEDEKQAESEQVAIIDCNDDGASFKNAQDAEPCSDEDKGVTV